MKKFNYRILGIILIFAISLTSFASQQVMLANGMITTPDSSLVKPEDLGLRAHTNFKIYTPYRPTFIQGLPEGETPASLACIYGFTSPVLGCPKRGTTALPTGGWGTIAIVDAYDNPNAETDLNTFSTEFGLPACTTANGCFSQVYASGTQPAFDDGWAIEIALDIEWAHAMAPNAKIVLVEATTNSNADLFQAEDVASQIVRANGGGMVSNSWGEEEYNGETIFDSHFQMPGVVYFASAGDSGAPASYPSSSPFVISAGGTSVIRQNGLFTEETAWSFNPERGWGGGGGPSMFESRPAHQNIIQKIVGPTRGTPDISFDANPLTGVDVFVTSHGGWFIVGGTSVSSPSLAGVINAANHRSHSTTEELNYIYANTIKNYHSYWHDIIKGHNGYHALAGYDFTTGWGSPRGYGGK